jgi:hypothetical protein
MTARTTASVTTLWPQRRAMMRRNATSPPTAVGLASALLLLVPSCLMTLAPVTTRSDDHLTEAEVQDVLDQSGAHALRLSGEQLRNQLVANDLNGRVEFTYAGTIDNWQPFGIAGTDYAFISVIGLKDRSTASRAAERMASRDRGSSASRGFVCANVIVQRITADGLNTDKLDRFLLERFAAAATNDRPVTSRARCLRGAR